MSEWTADAAYVMEEAGTICILPRGTYTKLTNGKALVAYYYHSTNWTGPVLVSTDPDAVTYSMISTWTYTATIEYLGLTWYVSHSEDFSSGNCADSYGKIQKLPGSYSSSVAAAQALLEIANVSVSVPAKYILKLDGTYYTNDLTPIEITEITPEVMKQYGSEAITADLTGYGSVEIFKYDTSEQRKPLTATVNALPNPQSIVTNEIDLSNPTITGIESVAVVCEGTPTFALSFDGGTTWKMHNGTAWVQLSEGTTGMQKETLEAITSEQWQEEISGIASMMLKFTLNTSADTLTSIIIDFTN